MKEMHSQLLIIIEQDSLFPLMIQDTGALDYAPI